jgi:predicted Zn-dependent protease
MKHTLHTYIFLFTAVLLLSGCGTTVTPQQERALGEQQAKQVLHKAKLSTNPTYNAHVRSVGRRIASVANRPDFHWQYYVLDNKTPNAFVLPGGKIFVNSGLFKYVRSDAELATVISHEVAHALRSHGIEGAQRKQNASLVGALLQVGMGVAGVDPSITRTVTQAYGYGATYGYIRPYSREKEAEADKIGLILMARAGYDPRAALSFWKKFAKQGQRVPEFFSTHPSTSHRIANLQRLMPQAMALYKKSVRRHRRYASKR